MGMNWQGIILTYGLNWVLPVAGAMLGISYLSPQVREFVGRHARLPLLIALYAVSRVGLFILLYPVLGRHVDPDVEYFFDRAAPLFQGQIPGRDVPNLYAPLFPYASALGLYLSGPTRAFGVIIPFIVGDFVLCASIYALAARLWSREAARALTLWVVCTPMVWYPLVMDGQDEGMFAGMLAATVALMAAGRVRLGMVVLGMGFCLTKITFGPYAGSIVVAALIAGNKCERRSILWFAGTVAAVYFSYWALGCNPWAPLGHSAEMLQAWCFNLSTIVISSWPAHGRPLAILLYAGSVGLASLYISILVRRQGLIHTILSSLLGVHIASMLFMPYPVVEYTVQGLVPIGTLMWATVDRPRGRVLIVLLGVTSLVVGLHRRGSVDPLDLTPILAFLLLHAWLVVVARNDITEALPSLQNPLQSPSPSDSLPQSVP